MIWTALNVITSLAAGVMVFMKLLMWHDKFNCAERVGLALAGAGCVLTIGPILMPHGSPYENWAPILFRFGFIILMAGHVRQYLYKGMRR